MGNIYINDYIKKNCSVELQSLFLEVNNPLKEITESMAAVRHLSRFIKPGENMNYIVIGDGTRCLTGACLAFLTKGRVWSIDPLVRTSDMQTWVEKNNVQRFIYLKKRYQDVCIKGGNENHYAIVAVHAHIDLIDVVKKFPNWRFLYTNPCCAFSKQTFPISHQISNGIQCIFAGIDTNIISEKNHIFLYHNNVKFPTDLVRL